MDSAAPGHIDTDTAWAQLLWQVEIGADEAISNAPVNRYDLPDAAPTTRSGTPPVAAKPDSALPIQGVTADPVAQATRAAQTATSLQALAQAMQAFDGCDLKHAARSFVFADGSPAARVMIVGEAPGRDEDVEGLPFVGRAGRLLDLMLAAIGLDRTSPDPASAVYITNVLPWRPPANRTPVAAEIAMFKPFIARHIALAAPEIVVLMGNTPCQTLLGQGGITRIRGIWTTAQGLPVLPMLHPAFLLRNPSAKREAWADMLTLKSRLLGLS